MIKKLALVLDLKQAAELIFIVDTYYHKKNENQPQWLIDLKQKLFLLRQESKNGKT